MGKIERNVFRLFGVVYISGATRVMSDELNQVLSTSDITQLCLNSVERPLYDDFPTSARVFPPGCSRRKSKPSTCRSVPMNPQLIRVSTISLTLLCAAVAQAQAPSEVRFNRDVRPILSAKCFQCHGPDEASREADLRLDTEEGILQAFGGTLDESEGWQRISSTDRDLIMPPADSDKELTPDQISRVQGWIEQGAEWEGHWSFVPPAMPEPPTVESPALIRNAIDAFVSTRLESEGLSFSPLADRERLLRRVTFDLTGLPPTLEEIDAYLSDESPQAYETVVDRLLASPHFGERMAVAWMDAARYGDSSVFHADGPRDMWPWRDWVIRAYNENKPFDQFTREQLAGDLFPEPTTDQQVATGFLRNNATTDEGGAIAEEYRVEYAVDRVKTTSMVWLGLSMECAQCHDHKYDPIDRDDYYRFFAYFNQASDPGMQSRGGNQAPIVDLFDDDKLAEADELASQVTVLTQQRNERAEAATVDFESWLVDASATAADGPVVPEDTLLHAALDEADGREVVDLVSADRVGQLNGPVRWGEGRHGGAFDCNSNNFIDFGDVGDFERTDAFSYGCWIKPQGAPTGAPLARMNDGDGHRGFDLHIAGGVIQIHLINSWPNNAVKVRSKTKLEADKWQHVFVTYDGTSKAAGVSIYLDGQELEWDIEQDALTDTIRTTVPLYIGRRNPGSHYKGLVDDVRIYPRELTATEVAALAGSDPIMPLLAKPADERTADEQNVLRQHFLTAIDESYQELTRRITETETRVADLRKPIVNVMVMRDEPAMRATYILDRGNYASPLTDRELQPGVPGALPPLPEGAASNRLGLADWLMQPGHPLTARVAVNRYWAMLFGEGIVRSLEDFGAQGEWPTHPALLDWLAVDFAEHGWDIQRCIKQIVMSHTYQQTSRVTPELLERDPENRLLARGPRFRLQGEFIRDSALAASGLLVDRIGGPSVKPYQPDGLWNEVSLSGNVRFVQDHGEKLYRRSLYIYWKRSSPAPTMTLFDAPTREKCTLRRSRTNTPLQALVTMNDVQYIEAARVLAERSLAEGGASRNDQITYAYRLVCGVRPGDAVLSMLREAYETELEVFQADTERATQLISLGESPRDESLDPAAHAAMTVVTSLILNLDETLTRG